MTDFDDRLAKGRPRSGAAGEAPGADQPGRGGRLLGRGRRDAPPPPERPGRAPAPDQGAPRAGEPFDADPQQPAAPRSPSQSAPSQSPSSPQSASDRVAPPPDPYHGALRQAGGRPRRASDIRRPTSAAQALEPKPAPGPLAEGRGSGRRPAPMAQAPLAQAPLTHAPGTEAPMTHAPMSHAPMTEAPRTEASRPQAPIERAERGLAAESGEVRERHPRRERQEPRARRDRGERRGGFARFLHTFASFVLVVAVIGGALAFFAYRSFNAPGQLDRHVVVDIRSGVGLATIAEQLAREGIIEDEYVFMGGVLANNVTGRLKAGEYSIPPHASMADVMRLLVEGKAMLYSVTIPEGWTSFEIVQKLNADPTLEGEIGAVPAEGTLLPETYSFPRGTTKEKVLAQMRSAQQRLLDELWPKRSPDLPVATPEEAMILASIVEKETGRPEERRLVAGVFSNRLRRGMRLQSDPTIIYGLTEGQGPLDRKILQSDIDRQTLYNTYQINGLPPTPIANPGRASIAATLDPAPTEHLFFVADGTGGHVFASTLAEHTRNVARWRQIERQQAIEKRTAPGKTDGGVVETETEALPLPGQ